MTMNPQVAKMMQQLRKAATPSDVYRNPVLDNVSIAAFQDPGLFVAAKWFPTVPVTDESFKYYVFDMNSIAMNKMLPRAPGDEAREGTWNVTETPGLALQFGYKEKVPEELARSAGPAANVELVAARSCAEVLLISEEFRAGALFTTGVWTGGTGGATDITGSGAPGANQVLFWNNAASTPILDVAVQKESVLLNSKRKPNTLILGAYVAPQLLNHPTIVQRINAGQTTGLANASLADLAKAFGVDNVYVAEGVYNSANEGAVAGPTNSFIFTPKSAWLGYVAPKPAIITPSAGYRFAWAGIAGNDMGIRTWQYWDQPKRSTYVEVAVNDVFQQVTAAMGMFFSAVVQ